MKDRKNLIGASDVPAIIGISPYKTPLQVWSEKTGEVEAPDLSDNQAVEWGTRLERIVSQKFSDDHGVKLIARKKRYVHPDYPFISCELDNIIAGTDEIVEIKTVNAWAWKAWENPDELPDHVVAQVIMQLGLSKRKRAFVACLCGGQKYIEKRIDFDKEMYEDMVKKCVDFWDMVLKKIPPVAMAEDNSFMVELYPAAGTEIKEASDDIIAAVAMLQQTKAQIIELEKTKKEIEARLKEVIGSNLGIDTPEYMIKWIPVKGSTFTVTKKDSRMLKITKKK